ncbi:MAG: hemerythrin domain-containing protein [Thermomicrobiales bacterium]
MALITQPLREEHQELLPHVEQLRIAADGIEELPAPALMEQVEAAYAFLTHHLIPHAQAEERALYPVVARVMGAPEATATMSRDHVEIGRLTEELGALRGKLSVAHLAGDDAKAFRRVLYGLYALVHVHFAKEEEVYLPLLDARLTAAEAQAMFATMEETATEAKAQAV